jgi:putative FmdB family regulatory protein
VYLELLSGGHTVKVEPAPATGLKFSHNHWEVCMPNYEFVCNACKKTFLKTLTIADHDAEKTACPHCGSLEVEQRWSAFSAITSKKSA